MDTFAAIADERRALADQLSGLTGSQQAAQSLCSEWSVHEVVGHLVVPLEVGVPKFLRAMLAARGSFDRANVRLAREQARRPFDALLGVLRAKADSRFTPPGSGPEAPLTDVLVHGLDIQCPLGLTRDIPPDRLRTSLTWLVAGAIDGLVPKGALVGLRVEADDLGWSLGEGPVVRGPGDALLLAVAGRPAGLDSLSGDGVPALRERLG